MAQYKTGTVDVTNGSASVVGVGTAWLVNAAVGNSFKIQGSSVVYTIVAIGTDTGLTISPVYAGATAAGQAYVIAKDYTPNLSLYEPDLQDMDWPILLRQALRVLDERVVNIAIGDTPPANLPIGGIWLDTSGAIYSAPSIGTIGDQAVLINTPLENIPVTIMDAQDVNACQLSVVSSNSAVIPSSAVSFGGTGNNRTLTVSGRSSAGSALLTVTAFNTYTGMSVQTSFTLAVALTQFTITASAGANGSISPTGAINVLQGQNKTFTATAASGYYVSQLVVDGIPMVGISQYTFNNVQANHTISAVFALNTAPTISAIADQSTSYQTPTSAIAFTVGDIETAVLALTVSATSSNQTLVPDGNIVLGGSGANRTVTVTPANGQSGTATITVTVSDGDQTASAAFILTVAAYVAPEQESGVVFAIRAALANAGTSPGVNAPLTTSIKDLGPSNLVVTATNMAGTATSGYAGSGTVADPYRAVTDGTDDRITVPDNAVLRPNQITVEAWIKLESLISAQSGAYAALATKYQNYADNAGYGLFFEKATGTLFWRVYVNGAWRDVTYDTDLFGGGGLNTSTYYRIEGSFDGRYSRLYINNAEVGTAWDAGSPGNVITQNPASALMLAAQYGTIWGSFFKAAYVRLRILNRALTAQERSADYSGGVNR